MTQHEAELVSFNLPEFLVAMREEQKKDVTTLAGKVDIVLAKVNDHETRIKIVEETRNTARWLIGVLIVALLGAGADFMFNHRQPLQASATVPSKGELR